MMKSVLIAIRPQWVEKIASGQKTIEVRKTAPKEVPFKAYIYESRNGGHRCKHCNEKDSCYSYAPKNVGCYNGMGKVIGEFICDNVERLEEHIEQGGLYYILSDTFNEQAQLDNWELHDYGKGKTLYGWHISDLKIYDKPRELSEFSRPCSYSGLCFSCKRTSFKKDGNLLCNTKITRPPQSWMYVEELQGKEE